MSRSALSALSLILDFDIEFDNASMNEANNMGKGKAIVTSSFTTASTTGRSGPSTGAWQLQSLPLAVVLQPDNA